MMLYLECILILLMAFVIIGPKDFPRVMTQVGDLWRRLKMNALDFYEHLECLSDYEKKEHNK